MKAVLAAVVVVVVLALSGCSDPAEPSAGEPNVSQGKQANHPDEKPTPEPEDTPTPEPTKGGMVAQDYEPVDATTEAEVEDFALEFMDAYDHVWLTGETDEFEELYTNDCEQCGRYVRYLGEIWGGGGRVEGGEYVDPKPEVLGSLQGELVYVMVSTKTTAFEVVKGSGVVDQAGPTEAVTERFGFEETEDGWRVAVWTTEE